MSVGTWCFFGKDKCTVGTYSFPPLDAAKITVGGKKARGIKRSIHAFVYESRVELMRLNIERASIIAKQRNAVPDDSHKSVRRKCFTLFIDAKHPAFIDKNVYFFVVGLVGERFKGELSVSNTNAHTGEVLKKAIVIAAAISYAISVV